MATLQTPNIQLIDKPRSSSKNRSSSKTRPIFGTRTSSGAGGGRHPASNPNSPYGSPTDSGFHIPPHSSSSNNTGGLKSALRQHRLSSTDLLLSSNNPNYFSEPEDLSSTSSIVLGLEGTEGEEERGRTGGLSLSKENLGNGIGLDKINSNLLVAPSTSSIQHITPIPNPGSTSSTYNRRVGFDTFDSGIELESTGSNTGGGTGVNYSFTISAKSAHFCRSKASRTFLVGTDLNEYSVHALDWLLSSLTENNDEVVVLRVIEKGSTAYGAWREEMEESREEAESVLEDVMRKNGASRQLSIIVEFAVGPIEETIHRMIEIYKPDSLIVGTRGKPDSVWKSAFMGSISKYCVARSPVPVVVVRPEDKVRESLERRLNDPKKRSYLNLVKSTTSDSHASGNSNSFARSTTAPSSSSNNDKRKSMELDGNKVEKEMKRFGTVG